MRAYCKDLETDGIQSFWNKISEILSVCLTKSTHVSLVGLLLTESDTCPLCHTLESNLLLSLTSAFIDTSNWLVMVLLTPEIWKIESFIEVSTQIINKHINNILSHDLLLQLLITVARWFLKLAWGQMVI